MDMLAFRLQKNVGGIMKCDIKRDWLLLVLLVAAACHAASDRPKGEPLVVPSFPEPPQQRKQWDGATNAISPEFESATKTLFEQGLADPRGCEYREIEIQVGDIWGEADGKVKTHGWILPNLSNSNQTFAVAWNGLIYPVVSMGQRTNLRADMDLLLNAASTNSSSMGMALYGRAFRENMSGATDSILPIKACLLLRLGENDAAVRVWNACQASLQVTRAQEPAKDPYLMLAGDWAWSLFDRTICAHMRGDVPLALVSARQLQEIQPKIETEAATRGFPHPQSLGNGLQKPQEQHFFSFLGQMPQLAADLERRAQEPKQKSVLEIGLTNFPSQSDRMAALIEDLDLVNARQMGQPGWVMPQTDPIVQALIKEGDAAVEPLLNCLENDKRLTCSVGFGRDFFRDRHVLPVARAALAALQEILQTQFENAAEIRAYWSQNKGLKLEDRWYQVLRNDKIGEEQRGVSTPAGGQPRIEYRLALGQGPWMEAARIIVQPDNVDGVPGSGLFNSRPLPNREKPKLRGEILRSKKDPSVTELLVKQASFVVEQANHLDQWQGVDAICAGSELTLIIAKWEKLAAVSPAQGIMRRAIELFADGRSFTMSSGHDLARCIPELTEIRVEGGDTNALPEYAAWIKSADEEKVEEYAVDTFEPLWRNPNAPTVATVSQWLFNDPASPWSKLPWQRTHFHDPLDSDLVKLPAFRRLLARELDNQTKVGSMQWSSGSGGNISFNLTTSTGGFQFTWPETESPADGTKVEVRRCDWVAWSLSKSKQISFFNPFAAIEKRDEAIKNAKAVLLETK
jgi:hypothetical protein